MFHASSCVEVPTRTTTNPEVLQSTQIRVDGVPERHKCQNQVLPVAVLGRLAYENLETVSDAQSKASEKRYTSYITSSSPNIERVTLIDIIVS